jgi:hypothetical protein
MDVTPAAILNIRLNGMKNVGPFAYAEAHVAPFFPANNFVALDLPFSFIEDGIDTYSTNLRNLMTQL